MVPAVRPSACDIAYPFGTRMPPRCKLIYLQGWLPGRGGRQDIGDDQRCLGQAPGTLAQEGRHVVRGRDQRVRQLRITLPCLSSHCLHCLHLMDARRTHARRLSCQQQTLLHSSSQR